MPSIIDTIWTRLSSDSQLVGSYDPNSGYSGYLQGGIWTRPLKREGAGETPEAFSTAAGRQLRVAAVIVDAGETLHSQESAIPTAYTLFLNIWFYAPATATGKDRMRNAQRRVHELLDDWTFQTDAGPIAFVSYLSRRGILDSESFPGVVDDYCRYQIITRMSGAT